MTERKRAKASTPSAPARKAARRRRKSTKSAKSATITPYRDLEIQTRRVDLDPAWRARIEAEIAGVLDRHPQVLRTHVTLTRALHQKKERDTVSIVANAAGRVFRVEKRHDTMEGALRLALGAFARAAKDLRRPKRALRTRRGRDVVPPQPATFEVSR
ncbi:MAG: HPF/RaiA family ribosome-associated protein [Hyphomicrobiales bacterium]